MSEEDTKTKSGEAEEQFEVSFRNGALANLKTLAKAYSVSEDELGDLINKGIKVLGWIKNAKEVSFEDAGGDRFKFDPKNL